jgi:hypothetical protein
MSGGLWIEREFERNSHGRIETLLLHLFGETEENHGLNPNTWCPDEIETTKIRYKNLKRHRYTLVVENGWKIQTPFSYTFLSKWEQLK